MPDLFKPNLDDCIAEAQREITLRERVYPRWVEGGKIKQAKADRQLEIMRDLRDDLTKVRVISDAVRAALIKNQPITERTEFKRYTDCIERHQYMQRRNDS